MRHLVLLLLFVLVVAGCRSEGGSTLPEASVTGISPTTFVAGVETEFVIIGTNLFDAASASFPQQLGVQICGAPVSGSVKLIGEQVRFSLPPGLVVTLTMGNEVRGTFTAPTGAAGDSYVTLPDGRRLDLSGSVTCREPTPVVAAFASSVVSGNAPLPVEFDADASTGDGLSYSWDFGDGASGAGVTQEYVFDSAGTYTVTLNIASEYGETATASSVITVLPAVSAVITASTIGGNAPLTVDFDSAGSIGADLTYSWDFGDGSPPVTAAAANHTFTTPGSFDVVLTATDSGGASATASVTIAVRTAVSASILASATSGNAPLTVAFDASGSTGDGLTYAWDFGIGTANGPTPSFEFSTPGTYTVNLTVADSGGTTATAQETIDVRTAVSASFTASPMTGNAPLIVDFDASTSIGDGLAYSWDFGDGSPSVTGETPSYEYSAAGVYTVKLTVTDSGGTTATTHETITVRTPVSAAISTSASSGNAPLIVVVDGTGSTGDGLTYSWDFGDGSPLNGGPTPPPHQYTVAGDYTVELTVTDWGGTPASVTEIISVRPAVTAHFTASTVRGIAPLTVQFDASGSAGAGLTYSWDFGDDSPVDRSVSPSHTFPTPGTYDVVLTVTDSGGTEARAPETITVRTPVTASISASPVTGYAPLSVDFDATGSTGDELTYAWDFGDGTPLAFVPTISHEYATPRTYEVDLYVGDYAGTQAKDTLTINVLPAVTASVTASATGGNAPLTVDFDASGSTGDQLSYSWSLVGGPELADGATYSHAFTAAGSYTMQLTVTDSLGTSRTTSASVAVRADVTSAFTASPLRGYAPLTVSFDASASTGEGLSYSWDYDDGSAADTVSATDHTFTTPGEYDVELNVTDIGGTSHQSVQTITVLPKVIATFTAWPREGYAPFATSFNAGGSTGNGLTYAWNFGDGSTGTGHAPTHHYVIPGNYLAQLTVTDTEGTTANYVLTVSVWTPVDATIAVDPSIGYVGEPMTFDASGSTGDGLTYRWYNADDDRLSTDDVLTSTFNTPGSYFLGVAVEDSRGNGDSDVVTFDVLPQVKADFTVSPLLAYPGTAISFDASASTGDDLNYLWAMATDPQQYYSENPTHTFLTTGIKPVVLTVNDSQGRTDTATRDVTIVPYPVAAFTGPSSVQVGSSGTFSSTSTGRDLSYSWSTSPATVSGSGSTFAPTFVTPGDYQVQLVVTDWANTVSTHSVQVQVTPAATFTQVVSSERGPLALEQSGQSWLTWGSNVYGAYGNGTIFGGEEPTNVDAPAGVTFVQISSGWNHRIALDAEGQVWTWGHNGNGQIGNASSADAPFPINLHGLPDGLTGRFVNVAAGAFFSMAVKENGEVWVWGENIYGQLGIGTTAHTNVPALVPTQGSPWALEDIIGGRHHTLAIDSDGRLWAWGDNRFNQVSSATDTFYPTPRLVPGLEHVEFTDVAAGDLHSLAIDADGRLWQWGAVDPSITTSGDSRVITQPELVPTQTGFFTQVTTWGRSNSALRNDGTLVSWGDGSGGQNGTGDTDDLLTPTEVVMPPGVTFSQVAAGWWSRIAIDSTGGLWGWGHRDHSGHQEQKNVPTFITWPNGP